MNNKSSALSIAKQTFIDTVTNLVPLNAEIVNFVSEKLQIQQLPKGTGLVH
jgi:hypothetical protein